MYDSKVYIHASPSHRVPRIHSELISSLNVHKCLTLFRLQYGFRGEEWWKSGPGLSYTKKVVAYRGTGMERPSARRKMPAAWTWGSPARSCHRTSRWTQSGEDNDLRQYEKGWTSARAGCSGAPHVDTHVHCTYMWTELLPMLGTMLASGSAENKLT